MGVSKRRKRGCRGEKQKTLEYIKKLVIGSCILIVLLVICTGFALINSINAKIISNVDVNGVDVSKLDIKDAYSKVTGELHKRISKNINIKYEEYETTISLEQLDAGYNVIEAVNKAYKVGRDGNIIKSNFDTIFTLMFGKRIDEQININEEELDKKIDDIITKLPGRVKQSSYSIEEENLIINPGEAGIEVSKEELKEEVIKNINKQLNGIDIETIYLNVNKKEPEKIDIEKIHSEIYKEAQDAYYNEEEKKLTNQVDGVDFKISIKEAKQLLEENKQEYVIPLTITVPNVTTADVAKDVFVDNLSKYNSRYDESNKNRTINIKLASEKIDGTIVMPNETFSYNKIVGARTIKSGYKEAAVYVNGKVVDGIGGGICQVSSTLYNAVLNANLEIVERRNHYFTTSYVPASQDATVSYGTIDFKFKNNRTYPIKIECTAKNGISQVIIKGLKEDTEYEVEIQSKITEVIPYTTKYIDNNKLEKGVQNIVQNGNNGCKSEAYKILKLNGKIVSKTIISKDSYNAMQEIIERGTK